MKALTPDNVHPPFAQYSHGIAVEAKHIVATSGQLGVRADGTTPPDAQEQAEICFQNIDAILRKGGLSRGNIIRLNAYVTGREHMAGYMAARDRYLHSCAVKPASTLMIVSGFTRPEFVVEIEALAAKEH